MKTSRSLHVLASLLLVASRLWAADPGSTKHKGLLPAFDDFSVKSDKHPRKYTSKILLVTARSKLYRTVISLEGKKEPNFAAHHRLVTWGCGTDCRGFAIVDRVSGRVYTAPAIEYVAGAMGNSDLRIDFRADSRLLVLSGLLNDDLEGKFFYEWTGESLKLLKRTPLVKEDSLDGPTEED